ncbi:hypothetical protein XELAEV_18009458mg [Xenopus laevis]|uniref:GIY-YIG domain-containing protein n=1 Tax=Xenopus laevis TaxID=8355 RepID=A0A974DSR4_XENLA|nr:hypothetical protein XELAEV_18009458mg [Xenopus laevis]
MSPCLSCKQCPYVLKGKDFLHPEAGYIVHLWAHFTCVPKYVIYVLVYSCGLIYTGETTHMIKSHISQHRSSINLGNMNLPVSRHFTENVFKVVPPLKNRGDREPNGINRNI